MFLLITFCVVLLIQFYFYVFLFGPYVFSIHKVEKRSVLPVSILVCAKNEEKNLRHLLPLLLDQNYPVYEIVLIDDGSSDGSLNVMNSFRKQTAGSKVSIQVISIDKNESKGKKFALSQGVIASKYEQLLFTDADCMPASKNWIQLISNNFSANISLVLGYGAYTKIKGSFLNKLIRFETLMTAVQYFSYARSGNAYMGVGRNIAYTKNIFQKANGFDTHLHVRSGDDDLFVNQVAQADNTAICDDPMSFTYSRPKVSFTSWITQKRRHITTSSHYKKYHKFCLGLFYLTQIGFYVLTIAAIVLQQYIHIILGLFLLRFVIWYIILIRSSNKLNEKDLIGFGPLYEISLIFIQLYIFLKNIISSPKNW